MCVVLHCATFVRCSLVTLNDLAEYLPQTTYAPDVDMKLPPLIRSQQTL